MSEDRPCLFDGEHHVWDGYLHEGRLLTPDPGQPCKCGARTYQEQVRLNAILADLRRLPDVAREQQRWLKFRQN